ncbi:MAG: T9SS type A sorting domain-containing protein [Ignavibacteriales bacterium]
MIKAYFLFTFYFAIAISNYARAQEYAPLQLGNVWVYQIVNANRYRAEIIDSAIMIDSIKYFGYALNYQTQYLKALRLRDDNFYVMKEDSSFPEPLNERAYYKKNAQVGDTWQVNYGGTYPAIYTITDTIPAYILDTLVTGKHLNENFGLVEWIYSWSEEFGKLAKFDWQGETQHYLLGCVIDGIVYGDTTLVTDVDDFVSETSYNLYQNYPNPFNPTTKIKYSIPQLSFVVVKVYDILGNEIATLVNEEKPAGTYEFTFGDVGTSRDLSLPSGIYFYQLQAGNFVASKKLILLK